MPNIVQFSFINWKDDTLALPRQSQTQLAPTAAAAATARADGRRGGRYNYT